MKALSLRNDEPQKASRPFDKDRDGFVIGEGAAIVVLEGEEHAKKRGAKIAAQLYQAGRYTHSSMIGGRKPFSASAVRSKLTGETPRALELDEIPNVQARFVEAAVRAKRPDNLCQQPFSPSQPLPGHGHQH